MIVNGQTSSQPSDESTSYVLPIDHPFPAAINPRPQEAHTPTNDPEGDATHGAKTVRTQYAVSGAGIKVGVISDSLDDDSGSYQKAVNAGYVSPVTVIPGQAGTGEAEGLAMLEIVHRIAPGAQLYFATGFIDEQTMGQSIKAMAVDGCKVIIDDIGYADENPFQDETIALAVDAVTAQGVLFFSVGGNSGNLNSGMGNCWEGDFVSANGDEFLDFAAASGGPVREKNLVTSGVVVSDIDLFWSEPDNNVTPEYDLYEFGPGRLTPVLALALKATVTCSMGSERSDATRVHGSQGRLGEPPLPWNSRGTGRFFHAAGIICLHRREVFDGMHASTHAGENLLPTTNL